LGDLGADEQAAAALAAVLADDDAFWALRKECALALGKNNSAPAQAALLAGLGIADARTRLAVVEQADKLPLGPELEAALARLFAVDPADAVRTAALVRLVRLKSGLAYKLCLQALSIESDKDAVRNAGIDGLLTFGKAQDAAKLQPLATAGNARSHRHAALDAYARLAKLDADPERRKAAAQFLAGMLGDWYSGTRGSAVGALVVLGEKSAVADLRRAAASDPAERVRRQANQAALDLEAQQSPQPNWDEMNSKLKALQEELDRLKGVVQELEQRTPQSP
jgi:hypothetical protein